MTNVGVTTQSYKLHGDFFVISLTLFDISVRPTTTTQAPYKRRHSTDETRTKPATDDTTEHAKTLDTRYIEDNGGELGAISMSDGNDGQKFDRSDKEKLCVHGPVYTLEAIDPHVEIKGGAITITCLGREVQIFVEVEPCSLASQLNATLSVKYISQDDVATYICICKEVSMIKPCG